MSLIGAASRLIPVSAGAVIGVAILMTPATAVDLLTDETPVPTQDRMASPAAPPTSQELTAILHAAVDPSNPLSSRLDNVERGIEATDVIERISGRAGKMMRVVSPRMIDPIEHNGDEATGRLQVTFGGSRGPTAPLQLTFKNLDGRWVLSARSICDVASFNGFQCPAGYAE